MPGKDLCLLSLDNGGVRGLSSLQILKQLMEAIDPDHPPKPCDYFDMIAGTGTGGLIAILLGRLQMDIDDCIKAYIQLADCVFKTTNSALDLTGQTPNPSRFNTKALEQEIKAIIRARTGSETSVLNTGPDQSCKVFVCATRMDNQSRIHFRSYRGRSFGDPVSRSSQIWQAARATSAVPSFFDPIRFGPSGEGYIAGGLHANNPVRFIFGEARDTFLDGSQMLEDNLRCLVSIGTGKPSLSAFGGKLQTVARTLIEIAGDTQMTATSFQMAHPKLRSENQYFRFNVDQGLDGIGLEDATQSVKIMAATRKYLESAGLASQIQECGRRLRGGRRGFQAGPPPVARQHPARISAQQIITTTPPFDFSERELLRGFSTPPLSREEARPFSTMGYNEVLLGIRCEIKAALDVIQAGTSYPDRIYAASFHVALRLEAFLHWYHGADRGQALGAVLTLTGSAIDAQAVTCQQYMKQTWPSSGIETLRAVEEALARAKASSSPTPYKCTLFDGGSGFECSVSDSHLQILITGKPDSIIEIGQQLAWLGAALQRSPSTSKMAYGTARITSLGSTTSPQEPMTAQVPIISMKIHFETNVLSEDESRLVQRGCCWHLLFQSPVIVWGYPISPRIHKEKGLEISRDLMVDLGNANYLTEFHSIPVLKGFFTMFVATASSENSLVWHFLCSEDGKRISYSDALKFRPEDTTSTEPRYPTGTAIRHFVGWAPSVRRLAGTRDADYDHAERSHSKSCTTGCELKTLTFNAGKYLTVGGTIGRGTRSRRLANLGDRAYSEAVNYTRKNIYVNMYDVEERRGWLFDGASIVLHLSRTQLSHNASSFSGNPVLKLQDLHLAPSSDGAEAAVAALTDGRNMHLQIAVEPSERDAEETIPEGGEPSKAIKKKGKLMLFHELVKRNLCLFEKMSEYQEDLKEPNAIIDLQSINRDKLEGWDFVDLVRGQTSLKPCYHSLTPSGTSWLKFTSYVNTINLLGRKFGPMIQPSHDAAQVCFNWREVPTGKDFLTTCVSTVNEICRDWGHEEANSFQLVDGIHWHKKHLLFEGCQCIAGGCYICDRAQVLSSKKSQQNVRVDLSQYGEGAVIFGQGSGGTLLPMKNIGKMMERNSRTVPKWWQNRSTTPPDVASQIHSNSTPGTNTRTLSQNFHRTSLNDTSRRASAADHSSNQTANPFFARPSIGPSIRPQLDPQPAPSTPHSNRASADRQKSSAGVLPCDPNPGRKRKQKKDRDDRES